ncbi:MAG: hypothetical protein V3V01_07290 [Acidimicrobiales bacterium]
MSFEYVVSGFRVACNRELSDLDSEGFADLDLEVQFRGDDLEPDGAPTALCAAGDLRGTLFADHSVLVVQAQPESPVDASWCVRQLIPLVSATLGRLVLHAGGNDLGEGSLLFVGQSGRGKSTLALALSRLGYPRIADDVAPIRFLPRAATGCGDRLQPISHIVFLMERGGDSADLRKLDEPTAIRQHIQDGFGEHNLPSAWAIQFDQYHQLVSSISHWSLRLPDDEASLERSAVTVIEQLTKGNA